MRRIRLLPAALLLGALAPVLSVAVSSPAQAVTPPAGPMLAGFDQNTLGANDDGSTGVVALPFSVDFFGSTYDSLYVNNNGNVTFEGALGTYSPTALTTFGSPIIAAFWADVDTSVSGSALVSYGTGTVDGHQAFGVNWPGVDCYDTTAGGLNWFQLLIIDRSDVATGDFDIEFNYNQVQWETGTASGGSAICQGGQSAHVGYTNGSTNALELTGSGTPGAFLDGGPDALVSGSQNSVTPGRYIFPIRSGGGGGSIGGTVTDNGDPAHAVAGALVAACQTGTNATQCFRAITDANGKYLILGVPAATGSLDPLSGYEVTVSPPSASDLDGATVPQPPSPPLSVAVGAQTTSNIVLHGPTPPPDNTVIEGRGTSVVGGVEVPVVYWQQETAISTEQCAGGTVTAMVTAQNTATGATETTDPVTLTQTGTVPDSDLGVFTGSLPVLYPLHGPATVTLSVTCPPAAPTEVSFSIYIDPSGIVVDASGNPVAGATVTLLSSDSLNGTYSAVPDGSVVMSPVNRTNPDTTDATGTFGWDVLPGFYEVQASANSCTVTSTAFAVPPEVTDLRLVLACGTPPGPSMQMPDVVTGPAVSVGATSVTLSGSVNPKGVAAQALFQYGSTSGYGQTSQAVSVPATTSAQPIAIPVTGLQPDTRYHYRLLATSTVWQSAGLDLTFTTASAPSPGPPIAPSGPCVGQTGSAAFLCAAYGDLLNRTPDSSGLATWQGLMAAGGTRSQVASQIQASVEYAQHLVTQLYLGYLHRAPDPGGLAQWSGALAGGARDEAVQAAILGSPEFYALAGGTPSGFVSALYQLLLGRSADSTGLATWQAMLSGGATRAQVAATVMASVEYRLQLVVRYYQTLLHRVPDPGGLATYTAMLAAGAPDEQVQAFIIGSPEYLALNS